MLKKKAILLVRVSTDEQSFDEQERELYEMAIRDGHAPDEILSIAHKESGIKLSEEARLGLIEMKKAIETGEYGSVYVWEISRIARTKNVLFNIEKYLVEHRIQLFVKSIDLTLLNKDGTVNEAADVVFTLWSQLAESEMRNKKARFRRAKKQKASEGKYSGGYIPFGYTYDINNDRRFTVKEEEAAVVRRIFDLYESGYSIVATAEKIQGEGHEIKASTVAKILKNRNYTGELYKHKEQVNPRLYPQIVSVEQFDRCRNIAEGRELIAYKERNIYFAKGLVRCPTCGSMWTSSGSRTCYSCYEARQGKRYFKAEKHKYGKCQNRASISINVLDSLLWDVAAKCESLRLAGFDEAKKKEVEAKMAKNAKRIADIDAKMDEVAMDRKRLGWVYDDRSISDDEYQRRKSLLVDEKRNLQCERHIVEAENESLQKLLAQLEADKTMVEKVKIAGDFLKELQNTTDAEKFELVHKHIKKVEIKPMEIEYEFGIGRKKTRAKSITIHTLIDELEGKEPQQYIHISHDGKRGATLLYNHKGFYLDHPYIYLNRFTDPRKVALKQERAKKRAERLANR